MQITHLKHKVQYVDNNYKGKQNAHANKVYFTFKFSVDRLSSYPFNQSKQHMRAVKCREWQKVEHRQIRRNKW